MEMGGLVGVSTPLATVAYHTDPFFAECRAYGRIIEEQKKGTARNDIVVPCHGFLFLSIPTKEFFKPEAWI